MKHGPVSVLFLCPTRKLPSPVGDLVRGDRRPLFRESFKILQHNIIEPSLIGNDLFENGAEIFNICIEYIYNEIVSSIWTWIIG